MAPDAFKGTLSANDAAQAIARAIRDAIPDALVEVLPLADGGDGTVAALAAAGYEQRAVVTRGPTGVPTVARVAEARRHRRRRDRVSLRHRPAGPSWLAPMTSTSLGLGDAVCAVLDDDPDEIVLGLGGSASTDGGTGLLVARCPAARCQRRTRAARRRGPRPDRAARPGRARPAAAGSSGRRGSRRAQSAPGTRRCGCGVRPAEGATPEQVASLEDGLAAWAGVLADATGVDVRSAPGAGAAGGCGAAAIAALGAVQVSGAGFVHGALGLADRIQEADLVITGEGRLDRTSLLNWGLGDVARLSAAAGVPVLAVSGQVALSPGDVAAGIGRAVALVDVVGPAAATADPTGSLAAAVRMAVDSEGWIG